MSRQAISCIVLSLIAAAPAVATAADRGGRQLTLRALAFGLDPGNGALDQSSLRSDGAAERSRLALERGAGFAIGLEVHFGRRFGLAASVLYADLEAAFVFELDGRSGQSRAHAGFMAVTFGPNLHLLAAKRFDLYLGLRVGFVDLGDGLGDLVHDEKKFVFQVLDEVHAMELSDGYFLGVELGVDVPLRSRGRSRWGLHGSARYLDLAFDGDDGVLELGALGVGLGLAYRF